MSSKWDELPRWDGRSPRLRAKHAQMKREAEAAALVGPGTAVAALPEVSQEVVRASRAALAKLPAFARLILKEVCENHDVSPSEVMSPTRQRHVVAARDEFVWRIHTARPLMSLQQIGKILERDDTTILHSLRKTEKARVAS